MSSQDKLEQILREIHVLIAEAPLVNATENQIVVDKRQIYEHLNRLSVAIYEIMDEYELTQQSRDRAERDAKRLGDDIVQRADRQAEDVYAASIIYTNDALSRIQHIMQDAIDQFDKACTEAKDRMAEEKRTVRSNQSELKGQLQDFRDTEKYLNLIEEMNRKLDQEREAEQNGGAKRSRNPYANIKPEIKINPEYFERIGMPLDENGNPTVPGSEELDLPDSMTELSAEEEEDFNYAEMVERLPVEKPEVKVNLDSEYFKRKRAQS